MRHEVSHWTILICLIGVFVVGLLSWHFVKADVRITASVNGICGNNILETGEQCDGADFGGLSCGSFNFSGGTLNCTQLCTFDISQCTEYVPPNPTISLVADPTEINSGDSTTLSWNSANTTDCSASWTSSTDTSGSKLVSPNTDTLYTISCTGPAGTVSDSAMVTVVPPAYPTASLVANPTTINPGGSAILSWSSANTTDCSASWTSLTDTSGSKSVSPNTTTTYTISCIGHYGTATGSAEVTVVPNSPPPNNGGGGGGGATQGNTATAAFSGQAFPGSPISLIRDGVLVASSVAGPDANFQISNSGLALGAYSFSLFTKDADGMVSQTQSFALSLTSGITVGVSGIFFSPTLGADKSQVKRGDTISFFGHTSPSANVSLMVHSNNPISASTTANNQGRYFYSLDTTLLDYGSHLANSKSSSKNEVSPASQPVSFVVGNISVLTSTTAKPVTVASKWNIADVNHDGKVNIVDFSILAYWYHKLNSPVIMDLNGDKKVDIIDFSIMAYNWTG